VHGVPVLTCSPRRPPQSVALQCTITSTRNAVPSVYPPERSMHLEASHIL